MSPSPPLPPSRHYHLYPYRWLILFLFSISTLTNAALWTTFAPISDLSSSYFFSNDSTRSTSINNLALTYQVLYLPGTVLGSYFVLKGSLRTAVVFGAVSTSLGAIVRYVGVLLDPKSETAYYASLVGQCMCALGQPMFVNSPGLLSANWFGVHERNIATTVASLFAVIGNAVGQVMPAIVVSEDEDTGETKGMEDLLLMQAIMATVCAVGCAGWFQVSSLRTPLINNSPSPRLSMNPPSLPLKLGAPAPPPPRLRRVSP